jgi:hypothetical protein
MSPVAASGAKLRAPGTGAMAIAAALRKISVRPATRDADQYSHVIQLSPTAAGVFVSDDSFLPDLTPSVDFSAPSALTLPSDFWAARLSVMYHPEPLNTIPTGWGTRRIEPPHSGHSVSGSSLNRWKKSKEWPHDEQR